MPKELLGVYITHDNGGRNFRVENYSDRSLIVYVMKNLDVPEDIAWEDLDAYYDDVSQWKEKMRFKYIELWVGIDPSMPIWGIGNAVLICERDLTYVYIGNEIIKFEMKIPIIGFLSPIGNNDVPYSYGFTKESYVLFATIRGALVDEIKKIKNEEDNHEVFDPYRAYFDALEINRKEFKDKRLEAHNIISTKMLVERQM